MGTRGYRGYRGRGRGKWKIFAAVLLSIILLCACAFLILQPKILYDRDGTVQILFPWQKEEEAQPDQPADEVPLPEEEEPPLEIVIEEPPHPVVEEMHALELAPSSLLGDADALLRQADEAGSYNTLMVQLKEPSGALLYASAVPGAAEAGASGSSLANDGIAALTASHYYTVARLSALHDSLYSFAHMQESAVLQLNYLGYIWYDEHSTHWLAPEKEAARQYVAAIARECADAGFDELLFDDFCYPYEGRLYNIKTDERTISQEEALSLLADALRDALDGTGVKLSVSLMASVVLAGQNEVMGQNVAVLAEAFDRIYVSATAEQIPALQQALGENAAKLVPVLAEVPASGAYVLRPPVEPAAAD